VNKKKCKIRVRHDNKEAWSYNSHYPSYARFTRKNYTRIQENKKGEIKLCILIIFYLFFFFSTKKFIKYYSSIISISTRLDEFTYTLSTCMLDETQHQYHFTTQNLNLFFSTHFIVFASFLLLFFFSFFFAFFVTFLNLHYNRFTTPFTIYNTSSLPTTR